MAIAFCEHSLHTNAHLHWLFCHAVDKARLAGIAAAAAAASHVTPGQRDKAVADAAAAVRVISAFEAAFHTW